MVHTAFEAAFGVSLQQFHADFEAWAGREQATMRALAYGSCREAARYIVPRSFTDGGGFPDFRVPLEFDADGTGTCARRTQGSRTMTWCAWWWGRRWRKRSKRAAGLRRPPSCAERRTVATLDPCACLRYQRTL